MTTRRAITHWPHIWFAIPIIWLCFALGLGSMVADSPTMDEQNHIARGLAFLRTGDPRLSVEHPPLTNSISALPLLTSPELRLPTDDPSWTEMAPAGLNWYFFADLLLWEYNQQVDQMLFLARLPILFMLLMLGAVGAQFARQLWGGWAGLLALFLLLLEPNLLAHGRYATTDLGGTFFILLASFLLWRLWQAEHWLWRRWLWLTLALGCAFGSKLSTLTFVPIFALLALLPFAPNGRYLPALIRRWAQLITAGLASLLILWLIFGLQWGALTFQSEWLRPFNGHAAPMPTFWAGVEQILLLSGGGRSAFLLGQYSDSGFLAYFPIAFAVKTPLAILLAFPAALIWLLRRPATRIHALYLFIPALLYFLTSMQSGLNIGYRHLLPMLPFLLIAISGLAGRPTLSRWRQTVVGALCALLLLETLTIHPHYLSFFNAASGGPDNGRNILIDSNIDWGQDLRRLKLWMDENDVPSVKLGWFGTARPDYYGIAYEPLPGLGGVGQPAFFDAWWQPPFNTTQPEPGVYAISVTSLWEFPLADKTVYAWFRSREPDAQIGHSILIYRVSP